MHMDSTALASVALVKQDNRVTVYRTPVHDSSDAEKDEDFRANLPAQAADEEMEVV